MNEWKNAVVKRPLVHQGTGQIVNFVIMTEGTYDGRKLMAAGFTFLAFVLGLCLGVSGW